MVTISTIIFNVAENLANSSGRLKFRESGPKVETRKNYQKERSYSWYNARFCREY